MAGEITYDIFKPFMISKQINPIVNQPYEAEIFLANTDKITKNVLFSINGQECELEEDIGVFETTFDSIGTYQLKVKAILQNPITKTTKEYIKIFEVNIR
jgi:hypothetical protein